LSHRSHEHINLISESVAQDPEMSHKVTEPQLYQNVVQNFDKRMDVCGAARDHLADIVFRV